jgi:hypothetical protein
VPIEGRILVSANDAVNGTYAYFIEGSSDNVTLAPALFTYGEVSAYMDRVVYSSSDAWPATAADVWTAGIDGTGAVNLTGLAGIGGVSCQPAWSPDARKIAFQHADPTSSLTPCEAGFHVWVMSADGTGAHPVMADDARYSWNPTWSPNGLRLAFRSDVGSVAIDDDGTDQVMLPNVADYADWSPDGAEIISVTFEEGSDGSKTGLWRRLVLTDAEGGNPRVLFERFVSDADVTAHLAIYGSTLPPDVDPVQAVREGIGPANPRWSPRGDRILLRAALPFDPAGPVYPFQVELWLYDRATDELTRMTENNVCEFDHSWNGDNTFPDDPEVTVDNVTVTFSEVISEGVTTIVRDDDPPDWPTGYLFDYEFYELRTTAQTTGPATICMTYDDADVPEGDAEEQLAILHYNEALQAWEDITTSRDPVGNVVCGQTNTLSPVAFYGVRRTQFPDVPAWGYGDSGLDPYWAYYQVTACVQAGIVAGYEDGTYQPTMAVTRDQMAVYVARALAGGDGDVPEGPATATFVDVPKSHWAYKHVEYAVAQNVVQGYDATHYGPTNVVDRGQMAVFIARAMVAPGGDAAIPDPVSPRAFPDVATTFWAYKQVEYCATQGVVQGYDDGYYHPERQVTRDQMAVYVARAFELPI